MSLLALAERKDINDPDRKKTKDLIKDFYNRYAREGFQPRVTRIIRLDKDGDPASMYPELQKGTLEWSHLDYRKNIFKRNHPFISDMYEYGDSIPRIDIAVPVYNKEISEDYLAGAIVGQINLNPISQIYIEPITLGWTEMACIVDSNGRMIINPHNMQLFSEETGYTFSNINSLGKTLITNSNKTEWSFECNIKAGDEKSPYLVLFTFAPINLEDTTWFICVASSYKNVIKQSTASLFLSILLIWIILLLIFGLAGMAYMQNRNYLKLKKKYTDEIRKSNKRLIQTQENLIQYEKLSALGQLLTSTAHELNNKIVPILGYSQILERRLINPSVQILDMLRKISNAAQDAKLILESHLKFARASEVVRQAIDIHKIIQNTVELAKLQCKKQNVTLKMELNAINYTVFGDGTQIGQVLLNLINNAVQAFDENSVDKNIVIITKNNQSRIRIEIEDNGPGIPPENIGKLFDPFFSTKSEGKGTGLGLSVCNGIVKAHNGSIYVESQVGVGSIFKVELPTYKKPLDAAVFVTEPEKIREIEKKPETLEKKYKILAIDDEEPIRELIIDLLSDKYFIDTVPDCFKAQKSIEEKDYDCILCDLRIPGMSGMEFYNHLKENHSPYAKRIIFLTGDTYDQESQSFIKKTGNMYLAKPFKIDDFFDQIEKFFMQ